MTKTKTELARALGIDRRLVARDAKRGMPTDSVDAAQRWRATNVRPRTSQSAKDLPSPYQDARTRWATAEADRAQLDVLERRNVLVHRDKVRAEVARYLTALRDALRMLPSRIGPQIAALTDQTVVEGVLLEAIDEVLEDGIKSLQ